MKKPIGEVRAFTTKNDGIALALKNDVTIRSGERLVSVTAQWDTGASISCISEVVVRELGLIPSGKIDIHCPTGSAEQSTYLVDVILPNNVIIPDLRVVDSKIGMQRIGMLVGMDIITAGDFAVSNYMGKTVFTFRIPSQKQTNYVSEVDVLNSIGPLHGKGKRKH